MPSHRYLLYLRYVVPILVFVTVLAGVFVSLHTNDAHWLNRSGALVAAIAAAAILLQVKAEAGIDSEPVSAPARNATAQPLLPIEELAGRLAIEQDRARLLRLRLSIVAFVVTSAMFGELLHGFGDLIMHVVFGINATH
jgi:hypothetical protein